MAHAIWTGSISFGLINIPVRLYSAITERSVRFNQIDTRNGARIKYRKVNAETGDEVPPAEISKAYEVSSGRYVVVEEEELASLAPRATKTIDLEDFVSLDEIDPIYFDGAYHVAPDERAVKAYSVLVQAMEKAGKVAVSRFVMRSKQYVAIMRPTEGRLLLSMLVYNDELNPARQIPEFEALNGVEVTDREITMAEQLVESLTAEWDPTRYRDTYRDEIMELIRAKSSGEEMPTGVLERAESDTVIDLMAALEASITAAQEARGHHPTANEKSAVDLDPVAAEAGPAELEAVPVADDRRTA